MPDGGDDDVKGQRPSVVIVGAGFAGLTVAKRLAKALADITLIDQRIGPVRHRQHDVEGFAPRAAVLDQQAAALPLALDTRQRLLAALNDAAVFRYPGGRSC